MTAIEVLATIFAVIVLIKVIILFFSPKSILPATKILIKGNAVFKIIYLVLALIVGYYILQSLSIVEISAVFLLYALLIGLVFIPYAKSMINLTKAMVKNKTKFLSKNWLIVLIMLIISLWTLYAIYV